MFKKAILSILTACAVVAVGTFVYCVVTKQQHSDARKNAVNECSSQNGQVAFFDDCMHKKGY